MTCAIRGDTVFACIGNILASSFEVAEGTLDLDIGLIDVSDRHHIFGEDLTLSS